MNGTTPSAHASGATVYGATLATTTASNAWPSTTVSGAFPVTLQLEPKFGGSPSTPNTNGTMNIATAVQHPYQRSELVRKTLNNFTTRSNVYGVWLTVGFFQVTDDTVRPVQLGAEIGKSENRQVRHHMFAIVDRTNLQLWPTIDPTTVGTAMVRSSSAISLSTATYNNTSGNVALVNSSGTALSSTNTITNPYTGFQWYPQANSVLTYEPDTDNEETVIVNTTGNTAKFFKNHPSGCTVISRGNPGPWLRYDPRNDNAVVPYFAVID
jgi:hypothetical protein